MSFGRNLRILDLKLTETAEKTIPSLGGAAIGL